MQLQIPNIIRCFSRKFSSALLSECKYQLSIRTQLYRERNLSVTEISSIFTTRVMRHWNRMPRQAMDVPSLRVFKARLNGALSNML